MSGDCNAILVKIRGIMQADFSGKLKQALSSERLAAYQQRIGQDGNLNLFSHYAWNMALSESLYPSLQMLEVALRNSLHHTASTTFGREDWFESPQILHMKDQPLLSKAKQTLQQQNKPPTPGRIIAELNFGFWTSLLDSRYEQVLWPKLIKTCFPHMPNTLRTRKTLSKRFNRIRHLRNRVFHHEPIWHWHDLAQQHREVVEAITWIEPALGDLLSTVDRFSAVYRQGHGNIERQLQRFC